MSKPVFSYSGTNRDRSGTVGAYEKCEVAVSELSELPDIIPVFPLPNVVLFPGVQLPLHIFEQRYRAMVRDVVDTDPPLIGMALLRGEWQEQYEGNPQVFPIGCVGKVAKTVPLPDGRFNILLQGLREYHIQEEFHDKSYRRARVEWQPQRNEALEPERREAIGRLLESYLQKEDAVQKLLKDPQINDELFINFFAFQLDLLPIEKQSLLDAATLGERATCLQDIIEFKLSESRWPKSGGGGKDRLH